MNSRTKIVRGCLRTALVISLAAVGLRAQTSPTRMELPDSPGSNTASAFLASIHSSFADGSGAQTDGEQSSSSEPSGPSATQAPAQTAATTTNQDQKPAKTEKQIADEQIKAQEQQRVAGVIPAFNVSYVHDAVSLTPGQKISLAFHAVHDPVAFGLAFFDATENEVTGTHNGYGWGAQGFFKRVGANYTDYFTGVMIGNAFLPALFHQDPRYFRLGHGTMRHRVLYAIATNFISKHDHTGKWEPNFGNILGNFASGGISNIYYPQQDRGFALTIEGAATQTIEGSLGSLFNEFWPDISRRYLHQDPTRGADSIAQAEDDKKAAKK